MDNSATQSNYNLMIKFNIKIIYLSVLTFEHEMTRNVNIHPVLLLSKVLHVTLLSRKKSHGKRMFLDIGNIRKINVFLFCLKIRQIMPATQVNWLFLRRQRLFLSE